MAVAAKGNLWQARQLFSFVHVWTGEGGNDRRGNDDSDKGQHNQERMHCQISGGGSSERATTESSARLQGT
jgi:hypothetical protein